MRKQTTKKQPSRWIKTINVLTDGNRNTNVEQQNKIKNKQISDSGSSTCFVGIDK